VREVKKHVVFFQLVVFFIEYRQPVFAMKLTFWGTRGSIPTSLTAEVVREKLVNALMEARGKELRSEVQIRQFVEQELPFHRTGTYGGNTPCVEIEGPSQNETVLCDGGSGLRAFGVDFFSRPQAKEPHVFHVFMSHLHYDHVQGIPFFGPGYVPVNQIVFHGCHDNMEQGIREQMSTPYFPVTIEEMQSKISFEIHQPGDTFEVAGFKVNTVEQDHPGTSYGYRFDLDGKSAVYSTDAEHRAHDHRKSNPFLDFIEDADILIFDAPYSFNEAGGAKEDWGHSSNITGVDFATRARVKHLVIFHHDPSACDKALYEFHRATKNFLRRRKNTYRPFSGARPEKERAALDESYPEQISLSYDGLILEV
tara:strand:+ start:976 stop:2073 length:1098 start_codon:yes stop_codon:yes gene_type:complete